ncbi:MAG: caspase domain-containing protein [Leptolyngbya sp. BL-A-14]
MAKIALLIGVSDYEPGLERLPSAVNDVTAMQQVLTHPDMGEFDVNAVKVLQNPDRQTMELEIHKLFANRTKEDLVLLYFSGHGVVDESGEFYFASRFTRKDQGRLVPPTAVAARSVRDWLEQSRSQHKVIILDSCFSGAFARGVKAKDSGSVNPEQFLGGKGTAILTASTSTQYALAQDGFDLSIYTHYLVEGIRTGGADQGDDGFIDMEELHAYTRSKVKEAAPAMTPEFYPVKDGYKIRLAKSPKDDPKLKYRKEAEQRSAAGRFSIPAKQLLKSLRRDFCISDEEAEAIEAEVLKPYQEYQRKLQDYRTTLQDSLQEESTLGDETIKDLIDYRIHLGLKIEDAAAIEKELLGETIDIDPILPLPPLLHTQPLTPPNVARKELDECDLSELLYIKNVRDPNGGWAYTLKHIQEVGGSVESRVFELFWLSTSKGAKLASKGDLMILNQQAKVTHIVEMLDDEIRKNELGYFRWVRVVWMPQEENWFQLPHQKEILGFEPPRFGGGTAYSFTSPNFGKFHAAWNNLQDFQQHVFLSLMGVSSPTCDEVKEGDSP